MPTPAKTPLVLTPIHGQPMHSTLSTTQIGHASHLLHQDQKLPPQSTPIRISELKRRRSSWKPPITKSPLRRSPVEAATERPISWAEKGKINMTSKN